MSAVELARLQWAVELHRNGDLAEAEAIYGAILEIDPQNADAWHLLGRVALQQGHTRDASARVLQAIRIRGEVPEFHTALGEVLAAEGRHADAVLCFREALRLTPEFVPALLNLGIAYAAQKMYREACPFYLRIIQRDPSCSQAFNNLGNALRGLGAYEEAIDCFQEALRLRPSEPEPAVNLAATYLHMQRFGEAELWARKALLLRPGLVEALSNLSIALLRQDRAVDAERVAREALARCSSAPHLHSNLASVLLRQKRFREAEAACRQALEWDGTNAEASNNLGVALQNLDRFDEAAEQLEAATRKRPEYSEAWTNLGTVRESQRRPEEALACFDEALRHQPLYAKAHFCRAFPLLRAGRLAEGLSEYEWRWKLQRERLRGFSLPSWDGGPLGGKTILLFAEQGLGDTLQFIRYAPLLASRGARIIVECQPKIAGLVSRVAGVAAAITPGDAIPPCDFSAPLMSLPLLCGTTLETIPAAIPYLSARPDLSALMESRISATGLRVGVAWAGNPEHASDRHRSMPLSHFAALAEVPDITLYSLAPQGCGKAPWLHEALHRDEGVEELAALIACLDLIVTVDTMPAHLAGALGKPVWTLLSAAADWRWFSAREITPWYPSMRLLRQERSGDWAPVVQRAAAGLRGSNFADSRRYEFVKAGTRAEWNRGHRLRQDAENSQQDVKQ